MVRRTGRNVKTCLFHVLLVQSTVGMLLLLQGKGIGVTAFGDTNETQPRNYRQLLNLIFSFHVSIPAMLVQYYQAKTFKDADAIQCSCYTK